MLRYEELSRKIIGCCFEVYNEKGNGFVESVYQECLEIELEMQDVLFESQPELRIDYKGRELKQFYKPDFICDGNIILELKAVKVLTDEHQAQLLNYLKATGLKVGYLINFGSYPKLEFKRMVLNA